MKKILIVIIAFALLLLGLGLVKDAVAKVAVAKGASAVTGLPIELEGMHIGLLNTLVDMKGLRIQNPAGYPDKYMLQMPGIHVDYELGALLGGRIHLTSARLDMQELTVIRSADGKMNLEAMKPVQEAKGKKPGDQPGPEKAPEEKEPMDLQIDLLALKIGKVVWKDYSGGGEPRVREYKLNLDAQYQNITSPQQLVQLIIADALLPAGLSIPGLNPAELKGMAMEGVGLIKGEAAAIVGTAVKSAEGVTRQLGTQAEGLTDTAGEAAKGVTDTGKQVLDSAGQAVEQTTESLKKLIPFGER